MLTAAGVARNRPHRERTGKITKAGKITKGRSVLEDIGTVAEHCRWAREHNGGTPSSAWSVDEQLAVALVLQDRAQLDAMGYTLEQATDRVCDLARLSPFQFTGWLNDVRGELERSGSS